MRSIVAPTERDWIAVKRIFRYLKGSIDFGILYRGGKANFIAFSDADYGMCEETKRSTSGVVSMIGTGAVTWSSRRQQSVALSTMEAELMAASEAAKDVVWIRRVLGEIDAGKLKYKPTLFVDNMGTISLINNPVFHRRSKHIEIRQYFVRERCEEGIMVVSHVASEQQVADIMTKPLARVAFELLRGEMGFISLTETGK